MLGHLASLYRLMNKHKEALAIFKKAMIIGIKADRAVSVDSALISHNIGLILAHFGAFDTAHKSYLRGWTICKKFSKTPPSIVLQSWNQIKIRLSRNSIPDDNI